jgi:hypothetical protein
VDRTNGELDAALMAFREDPSDANRARLMAAQQLHVDDFFAEQTGEFMQRTGVTR